MSKIDITADEAREYFSYDPTTGEFRWRRLQVDCDPVEEANAIIQDIAHDIATDWADYDDALPDDGGSR